MPQRLMFKFMRSKVGLTDRAMRGLTTGWWVFAARCAVVETHTLANVRRRKEFDEENQ